MAQAIRKTFLLIDDASENFYVGQFTRTDAEIIPSLQKLKIGDIIDISPGHAIQRKA